MSKTSPASPVEAQVQIGQYSTRENTLRIPALMRTGHEAKQAQAQVKITKVVQN